MVDKLAQYEGGSRQLQDRRPKVQVQNAMRGTKRRAGDDFDDKNHNKKNATEATRLAEQSEDEFDDSLFNALDENELAELEYRATRAWFEDDSKLYLLRDSERVGDANSWMLESYDRPPHDAVVFNISEDGVLHLTPAGEQRLKDVPIMIWDGGDAYRLYRTGEIDGQNLKEFYAAKLPKGVLSTSRSVGNGTLPNMYLRGEQNEFRSIENYNNRYNSLYVRDAAQSRFAAFTGRPARDDSPAISIRTDANTHRFSNVNPNSKQANGRASSSEDEFEGSFFDALDENEWAELEYRATREWFEDDSKLYLLDDPGRVGNAFSWMVETVDRPQSDAVAFNISEDGVLNMTPAAEERLRDVKIMVREGGDIYKLYRAGEIDGQNLEEFCAARLPRGTRSVSSNGGNNYSPNVYLRGERNEFRTIENFNNRYNSPYIRDAAQSRFAAFTGRPARSDIPAISIRVDRYSYQSLSDINPDGNTVIHGREMLIQSATGTALQIPPVAKLQNMGYVDNLGRDEQTRDALDRYRPQSCYPPLKVLVHDEGKLVNAEEYVVVNHNYTPLIEQFGTRDIFVLNYDNNGRPTGNYRQFSGDYHPTTLEQDKILGRHPPTERGREASIPHAIDSYGVRVRIPPPSTVDMEEIHTLNERLAQYPGVYHIPAVDFDKLLKPPLESESTQLTQHDNGRLAAGSVSNRNLDDRRRDQADRSR